MHSHNEYVNCDLDLNIVNNYEFNEMIINKILVNNSGDIDLSRINIHAAARVRLEELNFPLNLSINKFNVKANLVPMVAPQAIASTSVVEIPDKMVEKFSSVKIISNGRYSKLSTIL